MTAAKPLVWMHGEVKSPPFSRLARVEAGFLLRRLQNGEKIDMPASRPMPDIAPRCQELRIDDGSVTWRILYCVEPDAIVILEVFEKKSRKTPKHVLENAKRRLKAYRNATAES